MEGDTSLPMYRIWEETYWGELGLITFDSTAFPSLVFLTYIDWAKKEGYNIVVIDVLDTFREYQSHLSLLGIPKERYEDVKVIKIGGRYEVGKIVRKISRIDEAKIERELTPILESEYSRKTVAAIIGASKVFALYSRKEALSLVDYILGFIGNKNRKAFYFVNIDLMKNAPSIVLPMMNALCTTVVEVVKKPGKQGIRVVKALNFDLEGFTAESDLKEAVKIIREIDLTKPEEPSGSGP